MRLDLPRRRLDDIRDFGLDTCLLSLIAFLFIVRSHQISGHPRYDQEGNTRKDHFGL